MVADVSESVNGGSNHVDGKSSGSPSVQGKSPDANVRKPRVKRVASRYLSPSPSTSASTATTATINATVLTSSSSGPSAVRRFGSPLPAIKRSQSADRRRSGYNANAGSEQSASVKLLVSSAKGSVSTLTRSLSVSFQGESFSLPISKEKAANNVGILRKATPERKRVAAPPAAARDPSDSSKLMDRHRWPGSARQENSGECASPISRSFNWVDSGVLDDNSCGSGNMGSFLGQIVSEDSQRVSFETRLNMNLGRVESACEVGVARKMDSRFLNESCGTLVSELAASDTDSVSSGSTSGRQEVNPNSSSEISRSRSLPRGIAMSARFWQETNSRLRRLQDPGSPLSMSPGSRISLAGKSGQSKRFSSEGSLSAPRSFPSPTRGPTRPASPGKSWASAITSPLRGMLSPSRIRPGTGASGNAAVNSPSILSFAVDIRRGKVGEDRIDDAHRLRLLYNCYLLWRFVNARADATFMVQTQNVEKTLWGTWITISDLQHSVAIKRMKLLLLRRRLTLASILKGQINYLEDWSELEVDHVSSLAGANEALKASTLRLPVIENAVVNMQHLKNVMGSAVDVMQGMVSSLCSLSSKVEEMNSLVAELADEISKECFFLDHCKQLLSALTAMRVNDCSLRTQILQLNRPPSTRTSRRIQ